MELKDVGYMLLGAGLLTAALLINQAAEGLKDPQARWECTEVEQEVQNFRECLNHVGCRVDGPKAFGLYHGQKRYIQEYCDEPTEE